MLRLVLAVLVLVSLAAQATAFAPAPLPRDRTGLGVGGNEASVEKLRKAFRRCRSETVTIVLAVEEDRKMPRLMAPGSKPRPHTVLMDGGTGHFVIQGRKDGNVIYGTREGTSSLTYTFDQGADRDNPFTLVIFFVFVKPTRGK
jgi:hypothetical protein